MVTSGRPGFWERLQHKNERWRGDGVLGLLSVVVGLLSFAALLGHMVVRHGWDVPPPVIGDGVEYDTLGWELARGRGFALGYADPEFRRPYELAYGEGVSLPAVPSGPTARRPPLMPLLMAGLSRQFGRQFWGIRLVNCGVMAVTCGLVALQVGRLVGPVPALLAAVQFLVVDYRSRLYAREVLTESLSAGLVALLVLQTLRYGRRQRWRCVVGVGLIAGLMVLTRTMFVLWLPVWAWLVWRLTGSRGSSAVETSWTRRAAAVTLLMGAAVVVCLPWFYRNCVLLGSFEPLGTQGGMELAAGYSETAFARAGMWFNLDEAGLLPVSPDPPQSSLEQEQQRAALSRRHAFDWVSSHPLQAAVLPLLKVAQEFRPHGPGELYVLVMAVFGLVLLARTREGSVLVAAVLATIVSVGLTWSTSGRFVVPLLFVLHVSAAIALWACLLMFAGRATQVRQVIGLRSGGGDTSVSEPSV
jgi:hypothetical protein